MTAENQKQTNDRFALKEMTREVLEEMLSCDSIDSVLTPADVNNIDTVITTTTTNVSDWYRSDGYVFDDGVSNSRSTLVEPILRDKASADLIAFLEHELKAAKLEIEKLSMVNDSLVAMLLAQRNNAWSV